MLPEAFSRRSLLAMGAGILLPRRAFALGELSEVDIAELVLPSGTQSTPDAWSGLLVSFSFFRYGCVFTRYLQERV